MTTYADAITLILGFFVLLLSMSDLDPDRYREVKGELTEKLFGEPAKPVPFDDLADDLRGALLLALLLPLAALLDDLPAPRRARRVPSSKTQRVPTKPMGYL